MQSLTHSDAMLQKEATNLIDDRSALANQAVTHAV
jgi:hypothetical protein